MRFRHDAVAEFIARRRDLELAGTRLAKPRLGDQIANPTLYKTARGELFAIQGGAQLLALRSFEDGSYAHEWSWPADHHDNPFFSEKKSDYVVDEKRLLIEIGTALRIAAHHALRSGTFANAQAYFAMCAEGVQVGTQTFQTNDWKRVALGSELPNAVNSGERSAIDISAVANSERLAHHAAWFLLNSYFQANIGVATSSLMLDTGTYDLRQIGPPEALWYGKRDDTDDPDLQHLYDLNDRDFATLRNRGDDSFDLDYGTGTITIAGRGEGEDVKRILTQRVAHGGA